MVQNWIDYWDKGVAFLMLSCLFAGIYLLKDGRLRMWSMKHRASLRNGDFANLLKDEKLDNLTQHLKERGPVGMILRTIKKYRQQKMDKEIIDAISFLRNMASIEKGKSCSTDYIVERLSEYNGFLQPVYIKMLSFLRINQSKEAAEYFAKKAGTTSARDFAGLLIRWDRMEPDGLLETLLSYEKSMKAIRITDQKRKDEMISDLIYFPVVVNILVIFINFIYVAYFIDQKEMLQMFM